MNFSLRRLAPACATALACLAAMAGPALAEGPATTITAPADGTHVLYNLDGPSNQYVTVQGTAPGVGDGAVVRIVCTWDEPGFVASWDFGFLPVTDGHFGGDVELTPFGRPCRLRALPPDANPLTAEEFAPFPGPAIAASTAELDDFSDTPLATPKFRVAVVGLAGTTTATQSAPVGEFGNDAGTTPVVPGEGLAAAQAIFAGFADLRAHTRDGARAALRVDDADAWTSSAAAELGQDVGANVLRLRNWQFDEATGAAKVIVEDPVLRCAPGETPAPTCALQPSGVHLERTLTWGRDGVGLEVQDRWQSDPGSGTHTLDAVYDVPFDARLSAPFVQFPGEAAATAHDDGATVTPPAGRTGSVLVDDGLAADGSHGAVSYSTRPTALRSAGTSGFEIAYAGRTVPATGSLAIIHRFVTTLGADGAAAPATEDAAALAGRLAVKVDQPAEPEWSPSIRVTGTAASSDDTVDLTVNGQPVMVAGDGTWSIELDDLDEGPNPIVATVTDANGDAVTDDSRSFTSVPDRAAPVTTATPSRAPDVWGASDVTVTLGATDSGGSGLDRIFYRVSTLAARGSRETYDPADPPVLTDGQFLEYWSMDHAGNDDLVGGEAQRTPTAKVDKLAPAASASAVPAEWRNADVAVTLTGTDAGGSGVAHLRYRVDGHGSPADYDPARKPALANGQALEYWAVDAAGNESQHRTTTSAKVDKAAPTTRDDAPAGTSKTAVTVHLTAADAGGSGLARTVYQLDGGGLSTGTEVTVSGDGTHTIRYFSVDGAGNEEAVRTATVVIDSREPIVEQPKEDPPVGGGGSGGGPGIAPLAPKLTLGKPAFAKGVVRVRLTCTGSSGKCGGTLAVTATTGKGKARRTVTLGRKTVSVAAGKATDVKLTLSAKGRAAVGKAKRLSARVAVGSVAKTVTLTAAKLR